MASASDRARSASPLSTPASSRYPSRKPQPVIMLAVVLGGGCGRALAVRELIRTPCQGSRHPHTAAIMLRGLRTMTGEAGWPRRR